MKNASTRRMHCGGMGIFRFSPLNTAILVGLSSFQVVAGELAPVLPRGLPQHGQVVSGQSVNTVTGATLDIRQQTNKLITNWQSFNIGSEARVNFIQPGRNSVALNRITGQDPTQIHGQLNANGQVFLVNPNGVVFGKSATVNVGGLTASTLNISDSNFLAGRYQFERVAGSGSVSNDGQLTATDGGYLALLAPEVRNQGVLTARLGTVATAAGEKITLDILGDHRINVVVDVSTVQSLIDNRHLIVVDGGQAILSAGAADVLVGGTVNNSGVIQANSVVADGGSVYLKGGIVRQLGEVQASGAATGGKINIEGGGVYTRGTIQANGAAGGVVTIKGGDITTDGSVSVAGSQKGGIVGIEARTQLFQTASTQIDASGAQGGVVSIDGGRGVVSSASIKVDGTQGAGGRLDVTADQVQLLSAQISADGTSQGGQVRVGGEWQGGKNLATDELRNAQSTLINQGSVLTAKSQDGQGGEVVVWGDQSVAMMGSAVATGSGERGGRIEISSSGDFYYAGSVDAGRGGQILFDPKNLIIDNPETMIPNDNGLRQFSLSLGFDVNGNDPVVATTTDRPTGYTADTAPAVALSPDGRNLLVGNPTANQAFLFHFSDNSFSGVSDADRLNEMGSASLTSRFNSVTDGNIVQNSRYGAAVAVSAGDVFAVGAPNYDITGLGNIGAVHVYKFNPNTGAVVTVPSAISGQPQSPSFDFVTGTIVRKVFASDAEATAATVRNFGQALAFGGPLVASTVDGTRMQSLFVSSRVVNPRTTMPPENPTGDRAIASSTITNPNYFNGEIYRWDPNLTGTDVGSSGGEVVTSQRSYFGNLRDRVPNFGIGSRNLVALSNGPIDLGVANLNVGQSIASDIAGNLYFTALAQPPAGTNLAGIVGGFTLTRNQQNTHGYHPERPYTPNALGVSLAEGNAVIAASHDGRVGFFGSNGFLNNSELGFLFEMASAMPGTSPIRTTPTSDLQYIASNDISFNSINPVLPPLRPVGKQCSDLSAPLCGARNSATSLNNDGSRVVYAAGGAAMRGNAVLFLSRTDPTINPPVQPTANLPQLYSTDPAQTNTISPQTLRTALTTGSTVTLQANNDITVRAAVNGQGGNLTLQAGRSVDINASITTNGGDLTVIANDNNTAGVVAAQRDAGAGGIRFGGGAAVNAGTGQTSFVVNTGAGRTGEAARAGNIELGNVTAGRISAVNNGTGDVVLNGALTASGQGTPLVLAAAGGGNFRNNATGQALSTTNPNARWVVYSTRPDGNTYGSLDSGNLPFFGTSFVPDATNIGLAGNRFAFSVDRDITVTAGTSTVSGASLGKVYDGQPVNAGTLSTGGSQISGLPSTRDVDANGSLISAYRQVIQNDPVPVPDEVLTSRVDPSLPGSVPSFTQRGSTEPATLLPPIDAGDYNVNYGTGSRTIFTSPTGYRINMQPAGQEVPLVSTVPASVDFSITQRPLNVLGLGDIARTYGQLGTIGGAISVAVPDPDSGFVTRQGAGQPEDLSVFMNQPSFSFGGRSEINERTDAGTYVAMLNPGSSTNYRVVAPSSLGTIVVNPRPLVVSGTDVNRVFGDAGNVSAVAEIGALTRAGSDGGRETGLVNSDSVAAPFLNFSTVAGGSVASIGPTTDAGTYRSQAPLSAPTGNSNYVFEQGRMGEINIAKATAVIALSGQQCIRPGEGSNNFTYQIISGLKNGETGQFDDQRKLRSIDRETDASASRPVSGDPAFSVDGSTVRLTVGSLDTPNYTFSVDAAGATAPVTREMDIPPGSLLRNTGSKEQDPTNGKAIDLAVKFVADSSNNARFADAGSARLTPGFGPMEFVNFVGARYADRQERFSSALSILQTNPSAADLAECKPGDAPETLCIPSVGRPQFGSGVSGEITRKVAYLFGVQDYNDRAGNASVSKLKNPVNDVEAIGKRLRDDFGYEVNIIKDPSRKEMVLALKRAVETHGRDESVLIYFAGHGVELGETVGSANKLGYWLPVDATRTDPRSWISNTDVGKFMKLISAKQVLLVADSCFSGRFALEQGLQKGDVTTRRAELLSKRSVMAMSSGYFEEVDDGVGDNSPFALRLMAELEAAKGRPGYVEGQDVFSGLRAKFTPADRIKQTPQYSALPSAGYEQGGDFFIEKR